MTDKRDPLPDNRIALNPTKSPNYKSELMLQRRKRMLHETRKLIHEKGLRGFSVRALCKRAQIAQRTLYNVFHDRDRLIGIAIREAYDDLLDRMEYVTDENTLIGLMNRIVAVNRLNLGARNYAEAIATIYFSPSTPDDLWQLIQAMAVQGLDRWLNDVSRAGELGAWVSIPSLTNHIANLQFGTINEWCSGRLDDDAYLFHIAEGTLCLLISASTSELRQEAENLLMEMHTSKQVPVFPPHKVR